MHPLSAADAPAAEGAPAAPRASAAALSPEETEDAIRRAIEILLARQENLDGGAPPCEWPYEGVYRVPDENGAAQIPMGYRIGGTAISAWALIEAPGWSEDEARRDAVARATRFVLAGIGDPRMNSSYSRGYDVRNWGHIYALQFLLRLRARGYAAEAERAAIADAITGLIAVLNATAIAERGGWHYSRSAASPAPCSFMTAPAVHALMEARIAGEKCDAAVLDRAIESIARARLDTGVFQYSVDPSNKNDKGFQSLPGAIARMPLCESTLYLAGKGSIARIRASLDAFLEHWEHLEARRRKTGTHAQPYMIAPYYFYFAHFYAARAIELLPEAERGGYRDRLHARIVQVREPSGGWNDRVFDRSENFGTAMILLALLQPRLQPPAPWGGTPADEAAAK
ncbi:MAG: hypothetical protein L0Z55_07035 [Planctomycetes bacterium]|nr:hypothetical protein [Planctomycetota bacterium]